MSTGSTSAGSQRVIDLRGRLDQVKCLDCGHITREAIQNWIEAHNALQHICPQARPDGDADLPGRTSATFAYPSARCGGVVMPEVVFWRDGTRPIVDSAIR